MAGNVIKKTDEPVEIPWQEASLDIWDSKYRLKDALGQPVDADLNATFERVAKARGIDLGPITDTPDPEIRAIVSSWATRMNSDRALALGLPVDDSLDQVVENFIDDWLV